MSKKFGSLIVVILSCMLVIGTPLTSAILGSQTILKQRGLPQVRSRGTEYWAVLCAVGEYYNHSEQNRPSMLAAVDSLEQILLLSSNWQEDHIHKLKAEQATGKNLIKELLWLLRNEKRNDISLVYITTHGVRMNKDGELFDLWPKDEEDGADEVLLMYHGFENDYAIIWDDLLNFFLCLLQSKGVCVIIDSCFAGGFNDDPFLGGGNQRQTRYLERFDEGFAKELRRNNRVVLMSCQEGTVSYGSFFSNYLTEGFLGFADFNGNNDGKNSAEEAFEYAKPKVQWWTGGDQVPTILDLYTGELPITFS